MAPGTTDSTELLSPTPAEIYERAHQPYQYQHVDIEDLKTRRLEWHGTTSGYGHGGGSNIREDEALLKGLIDGANN